MPFWLNCSKWVVLAWLWPKTLNFEFCRPFSQNLFEEFLLIWHINSLWPCLFAVSTPFQLNRSKWVILARLWPEMHDFGLCQHLSQSLFEKFLSYLAHRVLITMSYCSINVISNESLKVGHFGPTLAQMGFPRLNSPMLYNGDWKLLITCLFFGFGGLESIMGT